MGKVEENEGGMARNKAVVEQYSYLTILFVFSSLVPHIQATARRDSTKNN